MKGGFLAGGLIISILLFFSSTAYASTQLPDIHGPELFIRQYVDSNVPSSTGVTGGMEEDDELRLWCGSWRLAEEANNLAPWKTVPHKCAGYVRDYVTGKAYIYDIEMVSREASAYARSLPLAGDGKDSWVFDIDETLLSNMPYYAAHQYGLEVFNANDFDKWVETAVAPPIFSSLDLYEEVLSLGFKVFLLTGRSEAHRSITVDNLVRAGFHDWERLILRGTNDRHKSATIYKSERRKELVEEGYILHGNSGDQWSDLLGSYLGHRSFKLPNPMYFIP